MCSIPQPGHLTGWWFPFGSLPSPGARASVCGVTGKVRFLFTDGAYAMVNAVVFLFHFDSHQFFLLMTKSYCLGGINISELLPSPNPIIYILEQENSKLLKDIILPLHSAYLQRNILLRGGKSSSCYYYFW